MPMQGRRISARTRYRTGDLMADDETLADAIAPTDPGTDGATTDTSDPLIDIDVSLGLF